MKNDYGNLMKIHAHLKKLQVQHPDVNVRFELYEDWSGAFFYASYSDIIPKEITLAKFNSFAELEKIINDN